MFYEHKESCREGSHFSFWAFDVGDHRAAHFLLKESRWEGCFQRELRGHLFHKRCFESGLGR